MNLHQLRLFCTVIELGSLTLAARSLFISQPALSIQMQRLERALNSRLLRRVKGGVVPTEAGRVMYESARVMLEQQRIAERRLALMQDGTGGCLSVGVSHTGALYLATAALGRFRRLYPDAEINLQVDLPNLVLNQLRAGTIDVLVDWEPVPRAGLAVYPATTVELLVTAAPDHPLAASASVSRAELRDHRFLALQYGLGVPGTIENALVRAGWIHRVSSRLPSVDALKRAVEAGLGVTMLAPFTVAAEVAAGRLVQLPLAGFCLELTLVAAVPDDREPPPLVRAFVDLFTATLANAGAAGKSEAPGQPRRLVGAETG